MKNRLHMKATNIQMMRKQGPHKTLQEL
jgi:hypothetical protein